MKIFDELEPYQKRVVVEMEELLDKIEALEAFIQSEKFINVESTAQFLLKQQVLTMTAYLHVLTARVAMFASNV